MRRARHFVAGVGRLLELWRGERRFGCAPSVWKGRWAPVAAIGGALLAGGCLPGPPQSVVGETNVTDPTNGGARYVGSSSCRQCHADVASINELHAHNYALNRIEGGPPRFPSGATRAGVPDPPGGLNWSSISYVADGYIKPARFVSAAGYVVTNGTLGSDAQWNISIPPNGTTPDFAPFGTDVTEPLPYDFTDFQRRTTGPVAFDPEDPANQDNRPGILGTWSEAGVRCEACHGPGSGHFSTTNGQVVIDRGRIYVDSPGTATCNTCHRQPVGETTGRIAAANGFIQPWQQKAELAASGAHAQFNCTYCHDPHRSVNYDRGAAIRNECTACHTDTTMAGHGGKVFRRDDYPEPLSCASCHMPYATTAGSAGTPASIGPLARMGDTRTHIFRINTDPVNYQAMFTPDGTQVQRDASGRAAVTVDFICLRCHNGQFGLFGLSVERAAEIAGRIHELP